MSRKIKIPGYVVGKDGKVKKKASGGSVSDHIRRRTSKRQKPVRRTV